MMERKNLGYLIAVLRLQRITKMLLVARILSLRNCDRYAYAADLTAGSVQNSEP